MRVHSLLVILVLGMGPGLALAQASGPEAPPDESGHVWFGLGGAADIPFGRSLMREQPMGAGAGLSLDLGYETQRVLLWGELWGGHFSNDDTYSNPVALSLRVGPIFGDGRFAPYVAAGPSALAFGAVGDDAATAWGVSGELGVLIFRDRPRLRLDPFVTLFLPLGGAAGKGAQNVLSLHYAVAGLRFLF